MEILNPIFGENLLNSGALHRPPISRSPAIQRHRKLPAPGRAISAFRKPNTLWLSAKESKVRFHSGADLSANGCIGAEERKITMGGATGDDLDGAGFVEVAKSFDDVAAQRFKVAERLLVKTQPELRDLCEMGLTLALEVFGVLACRSEERR